MKCRRAFKAFCKQECISLGAGIFSSGGVPLYNRLCARSVPCSITLLINFFFNTLPRLAQFIVCIGTKWLTVWRQLREIQCQCFQRKTCVLFEAPVDAHVTLRMPTHDSQTYLCCNKCALLSYILAVWSWDPERWLSWSVRSGNLFCCKLMVESFPVLVTHRWQWHLLVFYTSVILSLLTQIRL